MIACYYYFTSLREGKIWRNSVKILLHSSNVFLARLISFHTQYTEFTLLEYLYAMYGKYKYLDKLAISESDLKPIGNLNHVCGPPKAESVFALAKNDFKKKH